VRLLVVISCLISQQGTTLGEEIPWFAMFLAPRSVFSGLYRNTVGLAMKNHD
jgi:Na+/glutamate symporter